MPKRKIIINNKMNSLEKEDNRKLKFTKDMRICSKEILKIHLIDYHEVKIITRNIQ